MNLNEYQNYHETKSHTASEFPYTTYLCSIPLDFTYVPQHWHSELELIVIKKGKGIVSVDFRRRTVTAGDIVFIRPGQLHSIEQDGHRSMEYENIILKPELLISGESDLCAVRFINPLLGGTIPSESFITPALSYYKDTSECIRQIDLLCDTQPEGFQLAVKAFLFQFFFLLVSNRLKSENEPAVQTKTLEKLKTILKHVEEHYAEHITIEKICRDNLIGRSQLQKLFQKRIGAGIIEYFSDMKIDAAKQLIRTEQMNFTQISEKLGYSSIHYFSRQFKKVTGMTPSEYASSIKAMADRDMEQGVKSSRKKGCPHRRQADDRKTK